MDAEEPDQTEVAVRPKRAAALICLYLWLFINVACSRSASPVDPISGILDAFRSHQIVALGEGLHGNNQAHAFRLALIRDPRFPSIVNDLVVEFGSGRYQAVMDAFVRGADVPSAELRKAWQDTTNPTPIWDSPIYEEFFRAVRDVNASLPPERQLRVLLGEPPIDWDNVRYVRRCRAVDRPEGYACRGCDRERCCQGIAERLSSTAMVTFGGTASGREVLLPARRTRHF